MCGSITYYNGSGSYTDRIIAREDFLERIQDAIDCGECISYKITSPDKNFRKAVQNIMESYYDASNFYSEEAYEQMYEEQLKTEVSEPLFCVDELPF